MCSLSRDAMHRASPADSVNFSTDICYSWVGDQPTHTANLLDRLDPQGCRRVGNSWTGHPPGRLESGVINLPAHQLENPVQLVRRRLCDDPWVRAYDVFS